MLEVQVGREKTIKALEAAKAAAEATIRNIHAKLKRQAGKAPETVRRDQIRALETMLFNIIKPSAQFEQTQFLMQSGAKLKKLQEFRTEIKNAIAQGERQKTKTADTRAMLKEAKTGLASVEKQIADLETEINNVKMRRTVANNAAKNIANTLNEFSKTALTEAEQKRYQRLSLQQRAEMVLQKMENAEPETKPQVATSTREQYLDLVTRAKEKADAAKALIPETQKRIRSLRASKKGKTAAEVAAINKKIDAALKLVETQKADAANAAKDVGMLLKKGKEVGGVTPEAKYSAADIALAKLALDNRINAVLKSLEAMPPQTRTFDDIMRDIQLGTIKTPEGATLPETRVVTEYHVVTKPRPEKDIEVDRQKAEALYGPLEEKARAEYEQMKADPNATARDKEVKIAEIARMAKLRKNVKTIDIFDVPVRTVTRVSIDPETQAAIAEEEKQRTRAPVAKDKPKTSLQEAEEALAEAQDIFTQAEKELKKANETGNRAVITAAKAAYLRAQKGLSAIYAAKVKAEEKIERKIKPSKSNRGAVAVLDLDDSFVTVNAEAVGKLIETIAKDVDISWRVGDARTDIIDMPSAIERLKAVKARTEKMGIKLNLIPIC
jgi:hypothetical protein